MHCPEYVMGHDNAFNDDANCQSFMVVPQTTIVLLCSAPRSGARTTNGAGSSSEASFPPSVIWMGCFIVVACTANRV